MNLELTTSLRSFGNMATSIKSFWHSRGKRKSLLVRESAGLGDRRFVAVVQFERKRFLIGYCASSVNLLATLPDEDAPGDAS